MTRREPKPPLTFAGSPRQQEACRKRLVREVQRFRTKRLREAKRAEQILAAISCDVATLVNRRDELVGVVNLGRVCRGDVSYPRWAVQQLLGIESEEVGDLDENEHCFYLIDRVLGLRRERVVERDRIAPAVAPVAAPAVEISAERALLEAAQIVEGVQNEAIDWTREPQDDRERALRAEIIRMIVTKPGPTESVIYAVLDLRRLLENYFADEPASDLAEPLDELEAKLDEERAEEARKQRRDAIEQARCNLRGL